MPSENKELWLVAQRGSEASSDKEDDHTTDHTTELDAAHRAEAHARHQLLQATQMHAASAAVLEDLKNQLKDANLDPFERELIEEDVDHQTTDLARHMRRIDAWTAKVNTISAEISVREQKTTFGVFPRPRRVSSRRVLTPAGRQPRHRALRHGHHINLVHVPGTAVLS